MPNLDTQDFYTIHLDLVRKIENEQMYFNLSDSGTSDFYIKITKDGLLIDLTQCTVTMYVVKPNKNSEFINLEYNAEKQMYYCNLPDNFKNIRNKYKAQIAVYNPITKETKITRSNFTYQIESDVKSEIEGAVDQEEQENLLTELMSRLTSLEENGTTMVSALIDDSNTSTSKSYSSKKVEDIKKDIDSQIKDIENTKINYFITPEMFGAKGDGVTDDTKALQDMINYAKNTFTSIKSQRSKIYCISSPLDMGTYQFFDFGYATIKAIENMDYMLKIDTSNNRCGIIKNITFDCNNLVNKGIYIKYSRMFYLKDIQILNFNDYGIYSKTGNFIARDIYIDKNINDNSTKTDSVGIYLGGTDSKLYSISIKDCKIGIYNENGINYFTNVHCWLINTSIILNSICFLIKGSAVLANCYSDTYYIAIKNDNEQLLCINGLHIYINKTYYTVENVNNKEPYVFYLTQDSTNTVPYSNSIRKTQISNLSYDMSLTGFTNKAKFSNIDGQTFSEKIGNYSTTYANRLNYNMLDNLPSKQSTSSFTIIDSNYTIETNKLVKDEIRVVGDLILTINDKSLITSNKTIRLATIPSGYYPANTFFTVCTFGSDGGSDFVVCPLRVNSSSSGGRYLELMIKDKFDNNVNANKLRIHITYELQQ